MNWLFSSAISVDGQVIKHLKYIFGYWTKLQWLEWKIPQFHVQFYYLSNLCISRLLGTKANENFSVKIF